jgi:hypothetical protein
MLDFVKWRGDLPMNVSPFCEVDAVIFSQLAYLHFADALGTGIAPLSEAAALVGGIPEESGNPQAVTLRHKLLTAMQHTARYGDLTIRSCADRFDPVLGMQFAAMTVALPDGSQLIAYRGTDATVVGWREDFNMSFSCPVPSQTEAVAYLSAVAAQTEGPLRLCGHSKGGNLALYAAACCTPAVRERIVDIALFDAPGLDDATLATDGYRAALPRVRCYVPQSSLIGRLMGVPDRYTVVRSTAAGINQHNVFTWALDGPRFATLPTLDKTSRLMKMTMDEFLAGSTPDTRRMFVDSLFSALESGNATTLSDVAKRWTDTAGTLLETLRSLDQGTRKAVLGIVGTLASSGMESAHKFLNTISNP